MEEEEEEISVGLENNGRRFRLFFKEEGRWEKRKWRGNEGASVISVHTYAHM